MWRCLDCTLSIPLCRKCMRESHKQAPFHRIETWTGIYFRPASLWEVGTYLLVLHHNEEGLCETLQFQKSFLDSQQLRMDNEEQMHLHKKKAGTDSGPASTVTPDLEADKEFPASWTNQAVDAEMAPIQDVDVEMTWNDDVHADVTFEASLNNWLNNSTTNDSLEENFDTDDAETDISNVVEYLGPYKDSGAGPGVEPGPDLGPDFPHTRPNTDGLNNAYVRVLHTNGIHHIGMVTCSCQGQNQIPLDLVACRLLPASFIRIRTIFTTQLMDYFRLCNLELKASAYQFYQLIRRLTLPMGKSEMVNLYHEFRRMSRLWRWMKKLKWAGYGHNQQDHLNPPAGSLSIFCPTCPQPAANLPADWKLDRNRY